jgi:dienelactone hydrolase
LTFARRARTFSQEVLEENLLARWMHTRERRIARRDTNRLVRPFDWGADHVGAHARGQTARALVAEHAARAVERSEEFFALPPITDYKLTGDVLTWTSAVRTPAPENDTVRARFFPPVKANANAARRAVVLLPHWNAQPESHAELGRICARLGIAALRLSLPYHDERRPAELERADYLVCSNVGRTLQSMRQAVLDARAAVHWLHRQGYERIGIMGTSIGSCTAFLTFVHEPLIRAGVFNHVSGYFADVVWHGLSTEHVRAGLVDHVTLAELRRHWLPISPLAYMTRLAALPPRPMRFISARYDLTFPADLSRDMIAALRTTGHPFDTHWLPCGHYTLGHAPWKYLDGWKIVTFLRKHL